MNEQFLSATRAYLEDWADDGYSIIPVNDLVDYGFSGVWLRDLSENHQSVPDDHRRLISVNGKAVKSFMGVWTLDLLAAIAEEVGVSEAECAEVERTHSRTKMACLYTAAIRTALEGK